MKTFTYQTAQGQLAVDFELFQGQLTVGGHTYACDGRHVWLSENGRKVPFWVHQAGDHISVWLDGEVYSFVHKDPRQRASDSGVATDVTGLIKAQMPGKILSLSIKPGDIVAQGQNLLIMESMKMELALDAPVDGTVESVDIKIDQLVAQGDHLARITPS